MGGNFTYRCKTGCKENVNERVILFKVGKFYKAYFEDAWILVYLCGYKLIDGKKVGFLDSSLEYVKDTLKRFCVLYEIYDKQKKLSEIKSFKKSNAYSVLLQEAKRLIDVKNRIDLIIYRLKELLPDELDELLEIIDEYTKK